MEESKCLIFFYLFIFSAIFLQYENTQKVKTKASPGVISDTAQDTKFPRGFLLGNMIKYAEGCRFVHLYQRYP